jgi:hypothetical protein
VTLLAGQTAVWLGLAAGLLFALAVWALLAVFFVVFDGHAHNVADVQRFVALTEEARSWVPAGLPLFDGEKAAATTAALVRFQAKKDDVRRRSGVAKQASRDREHKVPTTRRRPSRSWQSPTQQSGGRPLPTQEARPEEQCGRRDRTGGTHLRRMIESTRVPLDAVIRDPVAGRTSTSTPRPAGMDPNAPAGLRKEATTEAWK